MRQLAKGLVELLFPGAFNRRYLAKATPKERELVLLPALLEPGTSAVDIGANRGLFVRHLLNAGAKVIAFEPMPPMQQWLKRIYGGGIRLEPVALADTSGTAEIRYPKGNFSWATLATENQLEKATARIRRETVPIKTLDSYGLTGVSFIKIDVEGYEEPVLLGARNTIERNRPSLLVESENRHNPGVTGRLFGFFRELGYSGYFLDGNDIVTVEHFDPDRDQRSENVGEGGKSGRYINNFIFLPNERSEAILQRMRDIMATAA